MSSKILISERVLENRIERGEYSQDSVLFMQDLAQVFALDEQTVIELIQANWAEGERAVLAAVRDIYQNGRRQ